ncbi:craniofacial development protein 2-like [Ostrinia nubilalis]|uniref:craniofacial development protein 2-like n=1 Tax=Ostrinia nubilalis TaxID=29057 RepID=UPI00308259C4
MGDFNAKLGMRSDDELRVGQFGCGQRNPRGQRLAEFLEKEDLFAMNSFFQKPPHRKWTWMSPDGSTKNEIDFIMTTKRRIFSDVSVINRAIRSIDNYGNDMSTTRVPDATAAAHFVKPGDELHCSRGHGGANAGQRSRVEK